MASTSSSLASLNSTSTHFFGSKININETYSRPMSVQFRPVRVSAAACSSTAERTRYQVATPPRPRESSLYDVLGIQMGATYQEIKTAYRRLARVLHPDVSAASDYYQNENSGFEFMKVNEAYETLSDPERRTDYDLTLYRSMRSPSGFVNTMVSSGFSGYTGRKWESDQCW